MINQKRFALNAVSNIASGLSGSILAIVLPPILLRHMSFDSFNLWSLLLQLGAYTSILNLGIQVAVGRYIALYRSENDSLACTRIVSTALFMLSGLALLGIFLTIFLALGLPYFFSQIPKELIGTGRISLFIVGASLSLALPFNVFSAIFTGLQRNHIPAAIIISSKLLQGLSLAGAAVMGYGLFDLACIFAFCNILQYFLQFAAHCLSTDKIIFSTAAINVKTYREIFAFCTSLTIWNVAMLMISGISVSLVAIFEYKLVAAFSLATSVITLMVGFQTALFQPLISSAASVLNSHNASRLGDLLIHATKIGTAGLVIMALSVYYLSVPMINMWVGSTLVNQVVEVLAVLLLGQAIRLTATPYSTLLIATGQQRKILLTPLVEGLVNLLSSIVLGYYFGAIGIAWGTVIGSVVGVGSNILYNFPKTKLYLGFNTSTYIFEGLLNPIICTAWPFALFQIYLVTFSSIRELTYLVLITIICVLIGLSTFAVTAKFKFSKQ